MRVLLAFWWEHRHCRITHHSDDYFSGLWCTGHQKGVAVPHRRKPKPK